MCVYVIYYRVLRAVQMSNLQAEMKLLDCKIQRDKVGCGHGVVRDKVGCGQGVVRCKVGCGQGVVRDKVGCGQGVVRDKVGCGQGVVRDKVGCEQGLEVGLLWFPVVTFLLLPCHVRTSYGIQTKVERVKEDLREVGENTPLFDPLGEGVLAAAEPNHAGGDKDRKVTAGVRLCMSMRTGEETYMGTGEEVPKKYLDVYKEWVGGTQR